MNDTKFQELIDKQTEYETIHANKSVKKLYEIIDRMKSMLPEIDKLNTELKSFNENQL